MTEREADDASAELGDLAEEAHAAGRTLAGAVAGVTFVVLHGVVGVLTASLGVVAPTWAIALLALLWAAVAVVGWRQRAQRPIVTMLLPFVNVGLVLGAVALGDALLGWNA